SGGHTQIVKITAPLEMEVIGETLVDAVGAAIDKGAKILGLAYPGGTQIHKLAQQGAPAAVECPTPEIPGLAFALREIKTAFLYFLRKETALNPNFRDEQLENLCASLQYTLIEILLRKLKKAARVPGINEIAIAGGVSANSGLRKALKETGDALGWNVYIPKFEYCTDNAAMIARAAAFKYEAGEFTDQTVSPLARMPLGH